MANIEAAAPRAGAKSKARIFISYSRRDAAFADRLDAALRARGFDPLIDRTEIYAFEDWWQRIQALIVKADTFVFVISPEAIGSEICKREIDFAISLNKRLAPVVCRATDDGLVPEALARVNFVFFTDEAAFEVRADQLAEALCTDIEWIRKHTELGEHSQRWSHAGRPGPRGLLLRSPVLEEAERWIASRPVNAPPPTEATREFIASSRRAANQRRNILTASLGSGLALALTLAALAYGALYIAELQRNDALIAQSQFLARDSHAATEAGDATLGALLALAGLPRSIREPDRPFVTKAQDALAYAFANLGERRVIKAGPESIWYGINLRPITSCQRILIPDGKEIRIIHSGTGEEMGRLRGHEAAISSTSMSSDCKLILSLSPEDKSVRLWDAISQVPSIVIRSDGPGLLFAAFSPDATKVVTTADYSARIWDSDTGEILFDLGLHEARIYSAEFSSDGKRLVTRPLGKPARLWNAETGALVAELNLPLAFFSHDGKRIVAVAPTDKKAAQLIDATDGAVIAELNGHTDWIGGAMFSADDHRILTTSGDKTARVWSAENGQPISVLSGHDQYVGPSEFSPDGKTIATSSPDGTARLWNSDTGASIAVLKGHQQRVWGVHFSPDGKRVLTTGEDVTVRTWDVQSGAAIAVLRGHVRSAETPLVYASFSADGRQIWTMSPDRTARQWSVTPASQLAEDRGANASAALSSDGARLVTWYQSDGIDAAHLWDAMTGQLVANLVHTKGLTNAAFAPDGSRLATTSLDGNARIWDAKSGDLIATFRHPRGEESMATAVYSPDGKQLATASHDGTERIWDLASGAVVSVLRGHPATTDYIAFSADGKRVLTLSRDSRDKTVRIWNVADGRENAVLRGHTDKVWDAKFVAGDSRIVTRSYDDTTRLWDAKTGTEIALVRGVGGVDPIAITARGEQFITLTTEGTKVLDATTGELVRVFGKDLASSSSFSPDGTKLVTVTYSVTILWNSATGALEHILRGGAFSSAVFFPDSKRLLTVGQSLEIWDVETGVKLARLDKPNPNIRSASLSKDGGRILLIDYYTAVWLLWLPRCQTLIEMARGALPRGLTAVDRATYFLDKRASSAAIEWYAAARAWFSHILPHAGESCQ